MTQDALFEDGAEKPLRLIAQDPDDLQIISSLSQDAVFPLPEMSWRPSKRSFAILLNRFRWEDAQTAKDRDRDFERVQSVLEFGDVLAVKSQGIDRSQTDLIMSLLAIEWIAGEDGTGTIALTLAGDGSIELSVECIEVRLLDVTRPYVAPSRMIPEHD